MRLIVTRIKKTVTIWRLQKAYTNRPECTAEHSTPIDDIEGLKSKLGEWFFPHTCVMCNALPRGYISYTYFPLSYYFIRNLREFINLASSAESDKFLLNVKTLSRSAYGGP